VLYLCGHVSSGGVRCRSIAAPRDLHWYDPTQIALPRSPHFAYQCILHSIMHHILFATEFVGIAISKHAFV
jgi:hypothetical protein